MRSSNEVNDSTEKVSSVRVISVIAVRSFRRRMFEMPSMKATYAAPSRDMSALCTCATRERYSAADLLKRELTIHITRTAMAMIRKASTITRGWAMSKAGCTCEMIIQISSTSAASPRSCRRMSAAAKNRRSPKKAAGTTRARKKTIPLITSLRVSRISG